jgi:plasmid rolling circle replication initiator protein Rep
MGTEQQQQSDTQSQQQSDSGDPERTDSGQLTEKPEVTDDAKEKAKEMAKSYNDDLQTTTLPGSGGTVSGTAVTDWVDEEDKGKIETSAEEGKVEYRNTEEFKKIQES